jgi:RNA polymerase sigma factor (TIGR02999 family)
MRRARGAAAWAPRAVTGGPVFRAAPLWWQRTRRGLHTLSHPAAWTIARPGRQPARANVLPFPAVTGLTELLEAWRGGDPAARDQAFAAVYDDLRVLARRHVRRLRPGETLRTTALVHETYLKLSRGRPLPVQDRAHFFALASRAMRQVLVDAARTRHAAKRGGNAVPAELDEGALRVDAVGEEILGLDQALARLAELDPRAASVIEWRYFGGLSEAEIAAALGVTERTVRRDWRQARAFLYRELAGPREGKDP